MGIFEDELVKASIAGVVIAIALATAMFLSGAGLGITAFVFAMTLGMWFTGYFVFM